MRKFTFNANQTTAQQQFVAAASSNPRKPWFSATYRDDLLRFATPSILTLASRDSIPFSYQAINSTSVLIAGYDSSWDLRVGTTTYASCSVSSEASILTSGYHGTIRGSWSNYSGACRYYYAEFANQGGTPQTPVLKSVDASGSGAVTASQTGLPTTYKYPENIVTFGSVRRPSAFIHMEHGDKLVVYTSYEIISALAQYSCTMHFYYAPAGSTTYRQLRTTIQYDLGYTVDATRNYNQIVSLDPTSGNVFASSSASGEFFVVANDGTKAVRFTYNNGVEGMLEPIIPIDLDANRLEITDSLGKKTYGKYHQFMPHALTKINNRYYLNGKMTRTYSNGDQNVMEVYLWSVDGINWAVGDVSFFIDSKYYKKDESTRSYNYCLAHPSGGSTVYALGNNCYSTATARDIDKGTEGTDFSDIVIEGAVQSQTNSVDSLNLVAMKGFDGIDPSVLGGKTISLNLGYYNSSGSVLSVKMGEYFVESESHELSNIGRGPNTIVASDAGAWKMTRWASITDVDRWSSTTILDNLKALSKLIVKGISSDYKAVDNATASGLYLSNLNDPFVGYTSTRDDRDGMFTVCARFVDTGSKHRLSSIGLLIGAEDYTDIYTNGRADRKGWNAYMIPSQSEWLGHIKTAPEMRKSNLRRRVNDPGTVEDESDKDRAYQWVRRYTSLWERDVYTTNSAINRYGEGSYDKITVTAATGSSNVIYSSAFAAEHGVDYEFVVRKQSGRAQLFARKKGFTASTVAASTHNQYTLIHEYQFGKDDKINWGPRPYWGFVANTDVFCSLEAWNSRDYGNIETSITEAYNNVALSQPASYSDFPDSNVCSFGNYVYQPAGGRVETTTQSETTQTYVYREPSSGGGYYENNTVTTNASNWISDGTTASYYIIQRCGFLINGDPTNSLKVGEIVRCFIFTDLGGALDFNSCSAAGVNINRGEGANVIGRQEFIGVIESITVEPGNDSWRRITFSKKWGGDFPSPPSGEQYYYAIYKVGSSPYYAKATSGSVISNLLLNISGDTLPIDIKNGTVKQSETSAGRGAIINRQNDAISIRLFESDGSTHLMYDGSPDTRLGYDYPTNPISSPLYVGSSGFFTPTGTAVVTTREWRLLMYQGRIFPGTAATYGIPDGSTKSYMIKGDEIVRYVNWGYKTRGPSGQQNVWCIIPAYYTPIFPSVKGSASVQQWSKLSGSSWVEPGDKFTGIANLSGLRLYINGKGGYNGVDGEPQYYAVSAGDGGGDASVATTLTFSPALKSGADSVFPDVERTKDVDKQLKEIAVLSGREQLGSTSGFQSYADPTCFYPVGPNATAAAEAFIKVHYWNMNAGLYNSAKDNLKYVCNLAGIADVQFMDKSGVVSGASTTIATDKSNSLLEMNATITSTSQISVTFRDAYKLTIDVDEVSGRGTLTLTLQTIPGFQAATQITGNSAGDIFCTLAKVSVPVADVALSGSHYFRVAVRKERVIVEMDYMPVWTFDLKTYTFGGSKNDQYSMFTDVSGDLNLACANITGGVSYTLVELSEEVENQILDMSQGGGDSIQFVTRERHIHTRSTQDGGLQFGKFLEENRESPDEGAQPPTQDYIKDALEYNPFQVPGHVLVTGAEYGEHIDPDWIRQNGYMFNTNQNRLLDTVQDSVQEAKLLMRMMKEDSDNSDMEIIGLPHLQPEDGLKKIYSFPESEATPATGEEQIISGHSIQFNQTTIKSTLKIRKKYSLG